MTTGTETSCARMDDVRLSCCWVLLRNGPTQRAIYGLFFSLFLCLFFSFLSALCSFFLHLLPLRHVSISSHTTPRASTPFTLLSHSVSLALAPRSNEGPSERPADNTAFKRDIAPQFGAMIVFAEHRYYGASVPRVRFRRLATGGARPHTPSKAIASQFLPNSSQRSHKQSGARLPCSAAERARRPQKHGSQQEKRWESFQSVCEEERTVILEQ